MMRLIHGISYVAYILWAIVTGSFTIASRLFVLREAYARPMIVELPLRCATDLEVTLFASSITITPGTLVTAIASGTATQPPALFVHALFEDSEESALEGLIAMESRLLAMTRGRAPRAASRDLETDASEGGTR
ncbi:MULTISPECIES: Na+/H+ antiporter subunit E [unclassified Brevibacterium]|uniref:Na+/H+ antiporter subunit E n=1 Tax=unclassified Brevibacterium TaxID=2614124 RepID=UPI002E7B9127|nr:Na+/H+ antiporter subunit E [Brevibacterium sp. CCUG 69071]